ncbi:MAG: hypothetical protein CL510_03385 [Actinobacteria bacterium]|nr:hypothetical protein [Actinomycetota bacterium]
MAKKPPKLKFGSTAGQWRLDASKFNSMLHDLAMMFDPPEEFAKIVRAETLSVLQLAAKKTKRVKLPKLKGRYNPNSKYYIKFVKINGRLYPTKPKRELFTRKWSPSMQGKIDRRMRFYKKRAFDRVNLSKAIFYKIAKDDLRLPGADRNWAEFDLIQRAYSTQINARGRAPRSTGKGRSDPSPSKSWKDSSEGGESFGGIGFTIKFSADTLNTLNPFTKGMAAFQSAINGRVGLFKKGIGKGFFDDAKWVAGNYPNVKVF